MHTRTRPSLAGLSARNVCRQGRPCSVEQLEARQMFSVYTATSLTLAGYSALSATGINAAGHVVGTAFKTGGSTGFVYKGASVSALAGTITAAGINDSDQIVGNYHASVPSAPEVTTGGYIRSSGGVLTKLTTKLGH